MLAFVLVGAVLVATGFVSVGSSKKSEGSGYATPESAVQAYLDAMKHSDVDAMIGTFAIESYVDHYDLEAYVARLRAYPATFVGNYPAGPVSDDFSRFARLSDVAQQISCQYTVLSNSDIDTTQMIPVADDAAAAELVDRLKAAFDGTAFQKISSAKLVDLKSELPELAALYESPRQLENMKPIQRYLGADEIAERLVRLSAADGDYYLFVELYRYGSTWRLGSFRGTLSNLQSLAANSGGLLKI